MKILILLESESYKHPPVLMGKIIADSRSAEIHVLVIVPKEGHLDNGRAVAQQVEHDLGETNNSVSIQQGSTEAIIRKALETEEYQLIIVNADRILRLRNTLDIEPILIKQTEISLLITQNAKPKIDRILLCTGCMENDYSLLTQAAGLFHHLGATVTLLHVIAGSVPTMYTGLDQIDETVEELLQTDTFYARYLRKGVEIFQANQIESEVKIRRGIPLEEIIRETQVVNYDLVVIGSTHVNQGLKELLLGNLAAKIIDRVELPVLVVGRRELEL
jgi:nucleotide-binding universal stress UspA family protein